MFLVPEEIALCEKLGDCWNDFAALEKMHPADPTEFTAHIHALQNMIIARAAIRAFPDVFTKKVVPKGT